MSNITQSIRDKIPRKLHNQPNHPVEIIKRHIYSYFRSDDMKKRGYNFETFDNLDPVVTIEENFDKLLIPKDHPARRKSDTYYLDDTHVLRTHTSAHQNELLAKQHTCFLVTGDVYRKDEVDSRHYPVFHQMEMLTILPDSVEDPVKELHSLISGLVMHLFPSCNYRFGNDYFPFTDPSFEVEVEYSDASVKASDASEKTSDKASEKAKASKEENTEENKEENKKKWLEILGCGVVQPRILENNGYNGKRGIAFGIGLERLVMLFCKIPDIRYLWSTHPKFLDQFAAGKLVTFTPYSILPSVERDISFFIDKEQLSIYNNSEASSDATVNIPDPKWIGENDFFDLARQCSNDYMEQIVLLDAFYNKKKDRFSRTYRCIYSGNSPDDRSPDEFFKVVQALQEVLRKKVSGLPGIELR